MKKLPFFSIFVVMMVFAVTTVSNGETIYGCYSNRNGALRIVPEGTSCGKSETPIAWSSLPSGGFRGTVWCKNISGYWVELPNADVFVYNHPYISVTNYDGQYLLSNLPDGSYRIQVRYQHWVSFESNGFPATVSNGNITETDIYLSYMPSSLCSQ